MALALGTGTLAGTLAGTVAVQAETQEETEDDEAAAENVDAEEATDGALLLWEWRSFWMMTNMNLPLPHPRMRLFL